MKVQKANIVEIFYSVQGEGKLLGKPSIFIRFFGCTLNCPGFGVEDWTLRKKLDMGVVDKKTDYKNWEVEEIARDHKENGKYKDVKELPLAKTGCDSYCSWHPAFKDLTRVMDTLDVVDEIIKIEKDNINNNLKDTEIVFTGGEPLLYQGFCVDVCMELLLRGAEKLNVTFETNGTILLNEKFKKFLKTHPKKRRILFSVSPKLANSGCSEEKAFKPGVVASYYEVVDNIYLKFVIDNKITIPQIKRYISKIKEKGATDPEVYLMPTGGTYDEKYLKNCKEVAQICLKQGFKYSPRIQVDLFKNEWGT